MSRYLTMARLLLLAALLFAALPAWPQVQPPDWIADTRTGCRVWNNAPQPKETITWSGTCSNGLAQGRGVLQWFEDGKPADRYEGDFRDGKQSGGGVYTWADGEHYEGEWRNDLPNGLGTFTGKDQVFSGTWTDGCFWQGDRWAAIGPTAEDCSFKLGDYLW